MGMLHPNLNPMESSRFRDDSGQVFDCSRPIFAGRTHFSYFFGTYIVHRTMRAGIEAFNTKVQTAPDNP